MNPARRYQRILCLLAAFLSVYTSEKFVRSEDNVSYFRRDGGAPSQEAALPGSFDETELVWRQPLPPGNSSPCISGGHIFLTTYVADTKELATVALDKATGKILWKQVAPLRELEAFHETGSPASSTPASDGDRVYVFFGSYGLLCYDTTGKLIWSKELGPFQDEFGAASSPIVVDNKVFLNEDHDIDSYLIALDSQNGETLWRAERQEFTRSYSTPVVWEQDGTKQIIVAGSLQLTAYDPNTGEKIWWVDGLSRLVDTTPIVTPSMLYLATWSPGGDAGERIEMESFAEARERFDKNQDGLIAHEELPDGEVKVRFFRMDLNQNQQLDEDEWNRHAAVFQRARNVAMAVRPGGKGDITPTHVAWVHDRGLPTVSSPTLYQNILYMAKDSGILTTLDATTGHMIKQGRLLGRGNYYSSIVAGDNKVYASSESGVMTILRAGGSWDILGSHDFGERIMATPVIHDHKMYLRTDQAIYCFSSKK